MMCITFGVILVELITSKRPLSKERKTLTSIFNEAMTDGTLIELLSVTLLMKTT